MAKKKKKDKVQALAIDKENFSCVRCDLHKTKTNYVFPHGNMDGKILLIGEAPGKEEDVMGQPFVGRAGSLLRKAVEKAGIDPSEINIHNCCMCRPPQNRQPSKTELEACNPYLRWVIENMPNLKLVVLLGATALQAVLKLKKITEKRGSLIEKDGMYYLPMLHPAAILRNMNNLPLFERDFVFAQEILSGDIKSGTYNTVKKMDEFKALAEELVKSDVVAVDIETSSQDDGSFSNFINDDIIGISFAWKEYEGWYIPFIAEGEELWKKDEKEYIISELRKVLKMEGKKLVFHNGKFDVNFLRKRFDLNLYDDYKHGGKIRFPFYFDTMLAHQLLNENQPHDLKWLLRGYSDMAFYEKDLKMFIKDNKIKDYGMIPLDIISKYAAADADGTLRLYNKFSKSIVDEGFAGLFFGLIMPLCMVLCDVEYVGVKMSKTLMESLEISLSKKIDDHKSKIYHLAGETFNINSRQQLGNILFYKLKLPMPEKKTASGQISTDAEVLKGLVDNHKIVEELLKYYEVKKLHSTYIVSNLKKLDTDDRIHTSYKQHVVVTGRLSSAHPNLQNIPAQAEFRKLFIAEEGHSFIISDYSQIELRVMATFSKDPDLVQAFESGGDIHTEVAKKILNKQDGDIISSEERRLAKTINFGLVYGMGPLTLAERLNVSMEDAERFLSTYFARFKQVAQYQKDIKMFAKKNGYVTTLLGRKRRLIDIDSDVRGKRMEAERQALNSGIQGTASECTNLAAVKIYFAFKEAKIPAKLVLTVHDELVYSVPNEHIQEASKIIYNVMRSTAENLLKLRVEVDQSINDKWVELKPTPPPDKIEKDKKYVEDYLEELKLPRDMFSAIVENYNKEVNTSERGSTQ